MFGCKILIDLCTVAFNNDGCSISTIEHLVSALAAFNIFSADIYCSSYEIPILDGSSKLYTDKLSNIKLLVVEKYKPAIKILKEVSLYDEGFEMSFLPIHENKTIFDVSIDFSSISSYPTKSNMIFELSTESFIQNISSARTFGYYEDAIMLRNMNKALGSNQHNTLIIKDHKPLIPSEVRFEDECLRHKVLDAIGDISVYGAPIYGIFKAKAPGHRLNNLLLTKMLSSKDNYCNV